MEDIARIGFRADTSQLVDAEQKIVKLVPAAQKAETASDKLGKKMGWAKDQTGKWGNELGRLVPKTEQAASGIAKLEAKTNGLGGVMGRMKGIFGSFGAGMLTAFGVGAATFGLSAMVSTLTEFESQMSAVAAVSGATGKELQALRDTAKDLGSSTEFSASQAASGLKLLVQAGYSAQDAIATIPSVLNLATTEAMDLGTATEYVNSIMAGFGLTVADAGRVTDVLVYASNAASTGVGELGEGMKYVAPIAAALNISIEDTAAALGVLSNAGIKGGQAGTSLRGVLASLANPANTAVDALKNMGLTVEDVNPATHSLIQIVDSLAGAGIDAASAFKIFGAEGAPAIMALVAKRGELKSLTGEMGDVAGEAKRIADYMRDNLMGSFQNLSSAVEGVIIALGDAGLTATLRFAFDAITYVLSGFTSLVGYLSTAVAPAFQFLSSNVNSVLAVIGGLATAITVTYLPAIASAIIQTGIWAAGFVGLGTSAIGAASSFVVLRGAIAATGFGAIAIGIGLAISKVLELSDELGGLSATFYYLQGVASAVWNNIGAAAQAIPPALAGVWGQVKADFFRLIKDMSAMWSSFLSQLKVSDTILHFSAGDFKIETKNPFADAINKPLDDATARLDEFTSTMETKMNDAATESANAFENAGTVISNAVDFEQIEVDSKLAALGLKDLNATIPGIGGAASAVTPPVNDLGSGLQNLGDAASGGKKGGGAKEKVEKLKTALEKLAEEFGKLTEPFDQAGAAFDALKAANDVGIISNDQFASSLKRIQDAFYATGGTADQWAKIVGDKTETVGKKLEELGKKNVTDLGNAFAELATGGSASFGDLARSIIKDLIAIAWQAMVVKPLLNFMGIPMANGGVVGGDALTGALQGAGLGAIQPFAKGSAFTNTVVSAPTPFQFAAGGGFGLGLMGEAGPEAVMPLTRGPDGSLGVQMYGQAATASGQPASAAQPAQVAISVQRGELFEPVVQKIAGDVSVKVTDQAVQQLDQQLPERINQHLNDPRVR